MARPQSPLMSLPDQERRGGFRPAATNSCTAPWSGIRPTCCTCCVSTSSTSTRIAHTAVSQTRDRYTRCPNGSPTWPPSRIYTSADATASLARSTNTITPPAQHGRTFRHPQGHLSRQPMPPRGLARLVRSLCPSAGDWTRGHSLADLSGEAVPSIWTARQDNAGCCVVELR